MIKWPEDLAISVHFTEDYPEKGYITAHADLHFDYMSAIIAEAEGTGRSKQNALKFALKKLADKIGERNEEY